MSQARVGLVGVSAFLPPYRRSSDEVEALVAARSPGYRVREGVVEALSGIRERRVAHEDLNASDLAAQAALRVLRETGIPATEVDVLIFAAAGQDLIEPATANIVQEKIGTSCPVFDLKNACNSFLNGLQVAEALILAGHHHTALVVAGELNSRAVRWDARTHNDFRLNFPGYTLGDAGAAALLAPSDNGRGIFYRSFATLSRFWDLATLASGGTMHPRGDEWTYIRGDGSRLREAFLEYGPPLVRDALRKSGTSLYDFDRILVHQVSMPYLRDVVQALDMPNDRIEVTLPCLGNMAAASLPVAYAQAVARGAIKPGDRVLWLGLASGISLGVLMMEA